MTISLKYKNNHPVTPKQVVVNVFDLGYLGVETDFLEHLYAIYTPYHIKRKETRSIPRRRNRLQQNPT